MILPGKLTIGFLQEDNPQKFYFRVRPLIIQDGETFSCAENVREEYQDDGYIRIVPDKNELSHFKARMRELGSYCLLDLRAHPGDNDKIRPNKNHSAEIGDRNAYIMYSDVVFATTPATLAEVIEAEGAPGERLIPRPGTPYVALTQKGRLVGLYRWEMQEMGARLLSDNAVPVEQPMEALSSCLFDVEVEDCTPRRILVDLARFGVKAAQEPVKAVEASEELTPAPVISPAPERPAERPERPVERTERPERPERPERVERPVREKKEEPKPWLQSTPSPRVGKAREADEQCGFNPRRGPSIKEVLDDMWRRSRVDQLGHPVPGDAQSVPASNPLEQAMDAVRAVWELPEARVSLVEALLKLGDMDKLLGLTGGENASQARSLRIGEEKLAQLEADRLKLLCDIDKLKKNRQDTRSELLRELEETRKKELAELNGRLEMLRGEQETAQAEAQRAKEAAAQAGAALTSLVNKQLDRKLSDQLLEGRARDMLTALVYGQETRPVRAKTCEPSAGEAICDLRVRFEQAGIPLSNDEAVNLLVCLAQGRILLLSGPEGSDRELFGRTLAAALGLRDGSRFFEMTVSPDTRRLGDEIEAVSPTGVPLVRLGELRSLLRLRDGQTPTLLQLDEANRAPIDYYAAELLNLGEAGAPQALHTPSETIPLGEELRVVMTLCEAGYGLPLTERVLDHAWTIRLKAPSPETEWRLDRSQLPAPEAALSLAALNRLFAPAQEVPGEVRERMQTLRKRLAERGVLLSRRSLSDTYAYCAAAIPLMTAQPMQVLDYALSQRVMPVVLASARLDALRDVSALFVDMPRCLALLDAPLPVPAFS